MSGNLVDYRVEKGVTVLELIDPPGNTYTYEMNKEIDAAILHTRANLKVADLAETSATKLSEARAMLDPVEERQSETG